jgi:hypothetical protein
VSSPEYPAFPHHLEPVKKIAIPRMADGADARWLWHKWCQELQVGDFKTKAGDPLNKPGEGSVVG